MSGPIRKKQKVNQDVFSTMIQNDTPRWTSTNMTVRQLVDLIANRTYDIHPEHQRDIVHDYKWREDIINSIFETGCIPPTFWHPVFDDKIITEYVNIDGKQRCNAFAEYILGTSEWKWCGKRFNELDISIQRRIQNFEVTLMKSHRTLTSDEIQQTLKCLSRTKQTKRGEVFHSDDCALRNQLVAFVEADKIHYETIFKTNKRKLVFENYAKLILIFASKTSKISSNRYYDLWMQFRNDKTFINKEIHHAHKYIRQMWNVLNDVNNCSMVQKQSKLIPLFCSIAFVKDSQRLRLIEKMKKEYFAYADEWKNTSGDQYAHHKRFVALREELQDERPSFIFTS